jgi:hypothetical protein
MAKLINNDDTLRHYLPNVFATVKGEVSLFDKVKVDIDLAENWVIETFRFNEDVQHYLRLCRR